ncbi:Gfo/Idh/MocA family oxidoreductase [Gordonia sp. VNQ95]|uniref:Gfo/Idh/MocA family protein n=1 Tax=Gordonia sp. VNQ95 TaxID=3156619 RepID=UPI0032B3EDC8
MRIGLVGLGKMGISHLAIVGAHTDFEIAGICDANTYLLDVLSKYCSYTPYTDFDEMLETADLDAVLIATPSRLHGPMVRKSLEKGIHVFCEKPFCLNPIESEELAALATARGLVTQVGYHNRFVGAFREVKRLLETEAIGRVTHVLAESYGPVVLKPKGGTWRSNKAEGGGCLYDYAAHPIDLVAWYMGVPNSVSGSVLGAMFSRETDDQVHSTLSWDSGTTCQVSVNWSDESQRKMTTKVTLWGTEGRIMADRQEIQVYLRDTAAAPHGYETGWNVKYTTELTEPVDFYLRGEEYSAQIDAFAARIKAGQVDGTNDFPSAAGTDRCLASIVEDACRTDRTPIDSDRAAPRATPQLSVERPGREVRAVAGDLARAASRAAHEYVQMARTWSAKRK